MCGAHVPLMRGLSWNRVLVTSGAMGVRLKSNVPFNYVYAVNLGLSPEGCSRLSIIYACYRRR